MAFVGRRTKGRKGGISVLRSDAISSTKGKLQSHYGGSDGLVGELLKYGGSGMVDLLQQLFLVIWREEMVPPQWREGLIVNLFKKGDKEDPGKVCTLVVYITEV